MNRVIVIGGSAGALEPLRLALAALPASLPASVFVVMHLRANQPSLLPELLTAGGPLPASHPLHGQKPEIGHVYVAPPDNHLMLQDGRMHVVRGPKEGGHRPAVDALFRTAAAAHGPAVIGVILSGYQNCGTAGMMSIRARGGVSVVQSPESAQVPEMPRSALEHAGADHCVSAAELPSLLERLCHESVGGVMTKSDRSIDSLEGNAPGSRAEFVCPGCHGVLTQSSHDGFDFFHCHVGHTFTASSLMDEQSAELERALWSAVRALEETSAMNLRLGERAPAEMRARLMEKATSHRYDAELIREVVLHPGRRKRS